VPATEGGPDAVWLTRWELPVTSPSFATQGHVFYAAMESDGGAAPTFYTGETKTLAAGPARDSSSPTRPSMRSPAAIPPVHQGRSPSPCPPPTSETPRPKRSSSTA
jgi:hypothetical protein